MFETLSPYSCKLDAEKVLDFVVNKLRIKGKIGVYGRSLGGIAACHLACRFPQIIQAMVVDRTFCEMDQLSARRLHGYCTKALFKMISCNWKVTNDCNFVDAKCYKILTCDPNDDVVDNYSSLEVGVAKRLARHQYNQHRWKHFYESLCLVFDLEDYFFHKMSADQKLDVKCIIN